MLRRKLSKKSAAIAEAQQEEESGELDKRFGFSKELTSRLEMGEEVGRGHFGYTCSARYKKGEHKDRRVAVKVIPKSKVSDTIRQKKFFTSYEKRFHLFVHALRFYV